MHFVRSGKRCETAISARNHPLASYNFGKTGKTLALLSGQ
jgi:hypothetical protein